MRRPLIIGLLLSSLGTLVACGADRPTALPDNAAFRSCLTRAGLSPTSLDTVAARHKAFAQTEPWNCVLALSSAGDRHDVLEGVFPPNDAALEKAMAAWIDTQDATGEAIAKDVGTLVAAADEPLPTDPAKQSVRSDEDDAFQARLAMAIYRHTDGDLVDYDAFVTSHDLTGDTSAPFRYFNHVMDEGGPIADRLRGYASAIDEERDELRAR